jgi:uncharacterized membrane protein
MSDEILGKKINVGDLERLTSVAVGGVLLLQGLRKRNAMGWGAAIAGGGLIWRGVSGHCGLYQAMGTNTRRKVGGTDIRESSPEIKSAITIGKSAEELYDLWRAPESLRKIMKHFADVEAVSGPELTHWKLKYSPLGTTVEWDSELTVQRRGEELSWATRPGTSLPNEGSVKFKAAPDGRGTEVSVRYRFEPPVPSASIPIVKAFSIVPKTIAEASLRHLKNLAETGEIPTLDGNVSARGTSDLV